MIKNSRNAEDWVMHREPWYFDYYWIKTQGSHEQETFSSACFVSSTAVRLDLQHIMHGVPSIRADVVEISKCIAIYTILLLQFLCFWYSFTTYYLGL